MRYRQKRDFEFRNANVDHDFWTDIVVVFHSSSSELPFATHTSQTSLFTYNNTFQTVLLVGVVQS